MNDAMTPEEEAFLNPERAFKPEPKPTKAKVKATVSKTVKKESSPVIQNSIEPQPQDFGGKLKLTVDINTEIGKALLRASLERKLANQAPHTQRDIVSEAVAFWLKRHGFLK